MGSTTLSGTPAFLGSAAFSYSAKDVRRFMTSAPIIFTAGGEGIVESGDFAVSQRAAGANQSVDVAAGEAYVKGDTTADEGSYYVRETGTLNVLLTAADATNPRIDRVVLEIKNDSEDASGLNLARIRTIDGTPTALASLTNLSGAAAVPNTCLLLANVLVTNGDATIITADIQDRRFGVPIAGRELFAGHTTMGAAYGPQSLASGGRSGGIMLLNAIGNGLTPVNVVAKLPGVTWSVAGNMATEVWDGSVGSGISLYQSFTTFAAGAYSPGDATLRLPAFSGVKLLQVAVYNGGASASTVTITSAATRLTATWAL